MKHKLLPTLAAILVLSACTEQKTNDSDTPPTQASSPTNDTSAVELAANPLLEPWDTPFGIPPFADISDENYLPAVQDAVTKMRAEVEAIVSNPNQADFENTIVALENTGADLSRLIRLFSNITGTDTNDKLKALQVEIYPMLTRERDAISLNEALFKRVAAVYAKLMPNHV